MTVRLSRRQALAFIAAGTATALAACGMGQEPGARRGSVQRVNVGASKADGRILFAKSNTIDNGGKDDGIYVVENGGKPRQIVAKQDVDYALQFPRWSPDGTQIAYARYGDRGIYSDLWIIKADGTNNRQITDFKSKIPHNNDVNAEHNYVLDSSIVAGVSWSRGGNFITFTSDKAYYGALRPWTFERPDQPPSVANLHFITATQNFSPPGAYPPLHVDNTALSADGSAMAFSGDWVPENNVNKRVTQIFLLDFATKKVTPPLTTMPWGAYDPAFSPDGQSIAFTGRPAALTNDLSIMTRDGKNQVQITNDGHVRAPAWSPDGKKLAYLSSVDGGQFNIFVMDVTPPADGQPFTAANFGKPQKLTDETGIDARSGLSWTA